jgi:8-oxo-dGTP diphosphatase
LRREVREEAGLEITIGPHIETFDRIHRDAEGRIRFHFVIVDYLCGAPDGEATAGTDADDVAWAAAEDIDRYQVNSHAAGVIHKGLELARQTILWS